MQRNLKRLAAVGLVAIVSAATAILLGGDGPDEPVSEPSREATADTVRSVALRRCRDRGEAALTDTACRDLWSENRRRFFGSRSEGTSPWPEGR